MKQNKAKRNIRILGVLFVGFMLISIGTNVYKTIKYKHEISIAQTENSKLKKEEEELNNEIKKLKDKNYIQSYVSGTIFSTEKGTSVYVLPKGKENAPE